MEREFDSPPSPLDFLFPLGDKGGKRTFFRSPLWREKRRRGEVGAFKPTQERGGEGGERRTFSASFRHIL